jgi:hypothetical protein
MTIRNMLTVILMLFCAAASVSAQERFAPLEPLPTLTDYVASADTANAPPPVLLESRPLALAVASPVATLAQTVPQQPPPARGTRLRAGAGGATLAAFVTLLTSVVLSPVLVLVAMPPVAALTAVAIMR